MCSGSGVDELPGNPHPTSCLSDAAFEEVANPQLAPDLFHIHGSSLVSEAGIASYYEETAKARQRGNDFLHHAIRKVLLVTVGTQVVEWQYGDGRLVW